MRLPAERGFTLVEVAVAIGVVAILAGAMIPFALRVVDQQREARTRDLAQGAFLGLFGSRDRRVPNLRSDIGFDPGAPLGDLSILVAKGGSGGTWAGTRDYGLDPSSGLHWGWNGPYWTGPLLGQVPVDAWGRPFQLLATGTPPDHGWQVMSSGRDGVPGNADDIRYPQAPQRASGYAAVLHLSLSFSSPRSGTVGVLTRAATGVHLLDLPYVLPPAAPQAGPYVFTDSQALPTLVYAVPAGGVVLSINVAGTEPLVRVVDLAPGEVKDLDITP